jgi:IS4 transposase
MQRNQPADSPLLTLPDLASLARETGFVVRESPKMDASVFLQTLSGAVASGFASLNQIAMGLSRRTGRPISSQAIHGRFSEASTAFLTAVMHRLFGQRFSSGLSGGRLGVIRRILVEDSSVQTMPKANAATFPAHGNRYGSTAGAKFDFAFDLLCGEVASHTLEAATEQDKTIGKEVVAIVRENDLVLRDMGYFSLAEFVEIERRGAWWLTRVPLNLGLRTECGRSLERLLQGHCGNIIDLPVKAGEAGHACRLVAIRASSVIARKRRKQRRKDAKAKGLEPDAMGLVRDGWHLMLTNLPVADFAPTLLRTIYRARWGVEIQFRAWKQANNLDKALNRKSGEHHLMAILLAAMINHLVGMRMARVLSRNQPVQELSYEKLYDALAIHHQAAKRWEELLTFAPSMKHVERDKRKRKSPVTPGALGLG